MGLFKRLFGRREEAEPKFELGEYPALKAEPSLPVHEGFAMPPDVSAQPSASPPGLELSSAPLPPARPGLAPVSVSPPVDLSQEMKLVQSKLDTIKAMLENINQRLDRLEQQKGREEVVVPLSVQRWRSA